MERGAIGYYGFADYRGEPVRAFIPHSLPPDPPLELLDGLLYKLEKAMLALGRLDAISTLLPDKDLFIYAYLRKEAVLSSQIEGTRSSLSDLLMFEADEAPGSPVDDVVEVSTYVDALEYGLEQITQGRSLSSQLIREIHGRLLAKGRGSNFHPGAFREQQNWIDGTHPNNAGFVPPPHTEVPACMSELVNFLDATTTDDGIPTLVRAGLVHLQFETIHPFLDGNGRIGRLIITLMLCYAGLLREPLLYLSLYLKQHRSVYYQRLDWVRNTGDWERWLAFFLDGVQETAEGAWVTSQRLTQLFSAHRSLIQQNRRRANAALRVQEALMARPIASLAEVRRRSGLSFSGASSGMDMLVDMGIAREFTDRRRNRLFAYDEYLSILSEGTEPL